MDFGGREVKTTLLDNAQARNRRSMTLPLMPIAWQFVGQHKYDTVITSHHAFAASNRLAKRDGQHLAYVHTPARYVWTPELDGRGTSPLLTPIRAALKAIDRSYVPRLTSIAANSQVVAERIETFWNRSARVINPPVDTERLTPGIDESIKLDMPSEFILGFGRWIPYKNMDTIIQIAEAANMPAVIAGRGPERERLVAMAKAAKVPVTIMESPSDDEARELYRRASVLAFPTNEDFGMVPVEVMACGTPVLGFNKGGVAETVIDGKTGALVDEHRVEAYAAVLPLALSASAEACRAQAESFGYDAFNAKVANWVESAK